MSQMNNIYAQIEQILNTAQDPNQLIKCINGINTPLAILATYPPFYELQKSAYLSMVNRLLVAGANPNASGGILADIPVLILAAGDNNFEFVDMLLNYGAEINAPSSCALHDTSLICAIYRRHQHMALFLLERGADPNQHMITGESALDVAIRLNMHEMAHILIQYGATTGGKLRALCSPKL